MREDRITQDGLLVGVYLQLNKAKGNIVIAAGLPSYLTSKHESIKTLFGLGYNIFVPRYYGSWESTGKFSPQTSLKSISLCVDIVKSETASSLFSDSALTWSNENIIMLGFSYGATFALCQKNKVDKVVLVAPILPLTDKVCKNINNEVACIKNAYPIVYTINLKDVALEMNNILIRNSKSITTKEIIAVIGRKDKSMTADYTNKLSNYDIETINVDVGHTMDLEEGLYGRILS